MTVSDIVLGWLNGMSNGEFALTVAVLLASTGLGLALSAFTEKSR
jgi:hypothetical protein